MRRMHWISPDYRLPLGAAATALTIWKSRARAYRDRLANSCKRSWRGTNGGCGIIPLAGAVGSFAAVVAQCLLAARAGHWRLCRGYACWPVIATGRTGLEGLSAMLMKSFDFVRIRRRLS